MKTKSDHEFNILQELKNLLGRAKDDFWAAAAILFEVRERKGYKGLGYLTFDDYCEDGLGRSRQTITQLLKAYEVAVIKLHFKPEDLPDYSKVYLVSEIIENDPENAAEWINKAETLSLRDLRDEKKEAKSGVLQSECQHPDSTIIVLRTCQTCGYKYRDYDAEELLKKERED